MKIGRSIPKQTVTEDGRIKLWHSQSVKQSQDWQSADATYGAELVVENDPDSIQSGIEKLQSLVEDALAVKVTEQRRLLEALSKGRGGGK